MTTLHHYSSRSRISPGLQSNSLQILSRVSKRTPFTLPCRNNDRLCSEIPIRSERVLAFIFRSASMTSSRTMIDTIQTAYSLLRRRRRALEHVPRPLIRLQKEFSQAARSQAQRTKLSYRPGWRTSWRKTSLDMRLL